MNEDPLRDVLFSIESYLNPQIFGDAELLTQIRNHLANEKLVSIRQALKETFAERLFKCIDEFSDWKVYEDYSEHFHYHHHNIYDDKSFPRDLLWCNQIFDSDLTKNFIQRLSGRNCMGKTVFSASLYLPGDHSLPHTDLVSAGQKEYRQVAFVWHLTKNWQHNWGGDLFWCPTNRYLTPTFNTLLLFTVGKNSLHFVTPVSPYAQSKRLAISGWWTGKPQVPHSNTDRDELRRTSHPLIEIS